MTSEEGVVLEVREEVHSIADELVTTEEVDFREPISKEGEGEATGIEMSTNIGSIASSEIFYRVYACCCCVCNCFDYTSAAYSQTAFLLL